MSNSQSLNQDLRQTLRLTPQQLRVVKLLEMNAPELDEAVSREVEENPSLEVVDEDSDERREPADADEPHYNPATIDGSGWREGRSAVRRSSGSQDDMPEWQDADDRLSLYDELNRQIDERSMPEDVASAAHFLIGSLDSNGYLRRPLEKLVDDMAFSTGEDVSLETMREAFEEVRGLEPYGIGAVDLQDCLLLQLHHLPKSRERDDAITILSKYYDAFTKKHSHVIISGMKIGEARFQEAMSLIKTLNPKPGTGLGSGAESTAAPVIPDAIVNRAEDGRLFITLNNSIPELRISESYSQAMRELGKKAKERVDARERGERRRSIFVDYNHARDFIQCLKQRQETFYSVVSAIVKIQREFFETDDVLKLKPMMIKDVAALTGQDISVVSRCTSNKYLATDTGIYKFRYFFSENKTTDDGESATNRELEEVIRRIVDAEDKKHPLSDEKIFAKMQDEGYTIKRRTVAKYRDKLGIPVARLRKEM